MEAHCVPLEVRTVTLHVTQIKFGPRRVVIRRPLTAEAHLRSWHNPFEICGPNGTGTTISIIPPMLHTHFHLTFITVTAKTGG